MSTGDSRFAVAMAAGLAMIAFTSPVAAQFPPQKTENLQVLPAEMPVREVIGVMRSFAFGLGVRCEYCHVGEAGQPLTTFDFVSDENQHKEKARLMLRMTQAINDQYLAELGVEAASRVAVRCVTCHRGTAKPEMLGDVLTRAIDTEGTDAAVARYEELRQEYYGSHSFDFTEWTLITLGEQLFQGGNAEAAEAMLRLNLEQYPESTASYGFLAELFRRGGDNAAAIEAAEKGLAIDPDDRRLQMILQQAKGADGQQ